MAASAPPAGFEHVHSGKVRDLYRAPDGALVLVASDRMSAFDFILDTPIPDKGRILTALSMWWFAQLDVANHLLDDPTSGLPAQWAGRATRCAELEMVLVESVARGYLAGSGLLDYRATQAVCGVALPAGLVEGDRLPEPIFTPTTKAPVGQHDEGMSYDDVVASVGADEARRLRELTLAVYRRAVQVAGERGIILADTKFEFGRRPGNPELVLADEVLTPDSSRFWPADLWRPGRPQPSYDKQYVRDWLRSPASGWDRESGAPPPSLPDEIVEATRERYVEAYERLTGLRFADWPG